VSTSIELVNVGSALCIHKGAKTRVYVSYGVILSRGGNSAFTMFYDFNTCTEGRRQRFSPLDNKHLFITSGKDLKYNCIYRGVLFVSHIPIFWVDNAISNLA
jgi:hypothetical protein